MVLHSLVEPKTDWKVQSLWVRYLQSSFIFLVHFFSSFLSLAFFFEVLLLMGVLLFLGERLFPLMTFLIGIVIWTSVCHTSIYFLRYSYYLLLRGCCPPYDFLFVWDILPLSLELSVKQMRERRIMGFLINFAQYSYISVTNFFLSLTLLKPRFLSLEKKCVLIFKKASLIELYL